MSHQIVPSVATIKSLETLALVIRSKFPKLELKRNTTNYRSYQSGRSQMETLPSNLVYSQRASRLLGSSLSATAKAYLAAVVEGEAGDTRTAQNALTPEDQSTFKEFMSNIGQDASAVIVPKNSSIDAYDIAVIESKKGEYALSFDDYGRQGRAMLDLLDATSENWADNLLQEYGVAEAVRVASIEQGQGTIQSYQVMDAANGAKQVVMNYAL